MQQELDTIIELSHEFGAPNYVKGGGGNTSVKNDTTMWIKPSGTTLSGLTAETMVAMNRAKIDELYEVAAPEDSAAREELVKNRMAAAVENDAGRPSVEAPLHNVFEARYVVHTHAVLVNGLTCAMDAEAACKKLFPEALWVEYIDPGYTLCMVVRERILQYRETHGREPAVLILQNHGIFVAADSAEEIHALYRGVMSALEAVYLDAGVSIDVEVNETADSPDTESAIRHIFGDSAAYITSSGGFACTTGPLTPDHMVYARAFPYSGELTEEGAAAYRAERGYDPKIVLAGGRIYGLGNSPKNADLAVELTMDGAQIMQLTGAFGGVHYMNDAQREFIENWEVESYREKQIS